MNAGELVDRFYDALVRGSSDDAVACLSSDARIWHSSDCHASTVAEALPGWQKMFEMTSERGIADVRRHETAANVCVQQHVFYTRSEDGTGSGLPCCIIVWADAGKITRIDEYLDLNSVFALPADGPITSPGLS
jgi:ketosteroid isomerase-like protein